MTIRAIIFDLGHTLWDITPQPDALARAYVNMRTTLVARTGRNDLPDAPVFQRAVRDVLHNAAKTYVADGPDLREPPPHEWLAEACRRLDVQLEEPLLREVTPPLFSTEIDGLVVSEGTLQAVSVLADAGYRLGCITNTLADTPSIRAMLRKHDLERLMRSVVVSTEEGWRKPHPSLFEKSTRELDVAPKEAVFVGDSPLHDVAGAKAVGMYAVLTRQYVERPAVDESPQPDAIIAHLSELQAAIVKIERRQTEPKARG
jgi:FMN phosphatase YigB (HAD superfamily)